MTTANQPSNFPTHPVEIIFLKPEPQEGFKIAPIKAEPIPGAIWDEKTGAWRGEHLDRDFGKMIDESREPIYTKEALEVLIVECFHLTNQARIKGHNVRFEIGGGQIQSVNVHAVKYHFIGIEWTDAEAWGWTPEQFYKQSINEITAAMEELRQLIK